MDALNQRMDSLEQAVKLGLEQLRHSQRLEINALRNEFEQKIEEFRSENSSMISRMVSFQELERLRMRIDALETNKQAANNGNDMLPQIMQSIVELREELNRRS